MFFFCFFLFSLLTCLNFFVSVELTDLLNCCSLIVMKGGVPNPESGSDQSENESVKHLWELGFDALQNENEEDESSKTIAMSELASCG